MLGVDIEKIIRPITESMNKFGDVMIQMNNSLNKVIQLLEEINEKLDDDTEDTPIV